MVWRNDIVSEAIGAKLIVDRFTFIFNGAILNFAKEVTFCEWEARENVRTMNRQTRILLHAVT